MNTPPLTRPASDASGRPGQPPDASRPPAKIKHPSARLIALTALVVVALLAANGAFAQQPPSAVFRPALLDLSAGNYSYSTKADVEHGGVLGAVAVHHFETSLSGRHELHDGLQLAYGLAYDTNLLLADATVPLPDNLTVFSVNFGFIRTLDSAWTAALFARPGFYSDFKQLGSRSLNMPVLVSVRYAPRRELAWTFALSLNPFAKNPALPVIGVRWEFAPEWDFALGFPRTGLTWHATDGLALRADASFQGGSYRITHPPPTAPVLDGTLVDYREIRAGFGLDFQLSQASTLSLDAGLVADRRFDYYQRGFRLDGRSAAFVKLALDARF